MDFKDIEPNRPYTVIKSSADKSVLLGDNLFWRNDEESNYVVLNRSAEVYDEGIAHIHSQKFSKEQLDSLDFQVKKTPKSITGMRRILKKNPYRISLKEMIERVRETANSFVGQSTNTEEPFDETYEKCAIEFQQVADWLTELWCRRQADPEYSNLETML